jgi:hypothetical protein
MNDDMDGLEGVVGVIDTAELEDVGRGSAK